MLMLEGAGKTPAFKMFQGAKTHADLRAAAAACAEHPHFTGEPGRVPTTLVPADDLPEAPSLAINSWRTVSPDWMRMKARQATTAPKAAAPGLARPAKRTIDQVEGGSG